MPRGDEVLPLVNRLMEAFDNVVITPHLGYVTEENYRRYYEDMVDQMTLGKLRF